MSVKSSLEKIILMSKGYFLTTIINQSLPFILLPVLTRYLTTDEYGSLSLYSFFHVVAFSLVGSSLPTIVSKFFFEKSKEFISLLIFNCIFCSLVFSCLLALIILLIHPWLNDYISIPFVWMILVPFGAFANVIFMLGLNVCRNRQKVFHFSLHQIGNTLVNFVVSIVLVCLFYAGWHGRAIGFIFSYFISAFFVICYLKRTGYLIFSFDLDLSKQIIKFIFPLIFNSLQLVLISQVGIFFMQLYFSKDLLGLYSLGFQISYCVKLLIDTLVMSWSPFFFKQLSMNDDMDKENLIRLFYTLIGILVFGSVLTVLLAKPILWIMSTPVFYSAEKFVPYFVLGLFFYGVYCFFNPILIKYNQQVFIGVVSFLSMVLMFVLDILLPRFYGYMGIPYAYCSTYIFFSIIMIVRTMKIMKFPLMPLKNNKCKE